MDDATLPDPVAPCVCSAVPVVDVSVLDLPVVAAVPVPLSVAEYLDQARVAHVRYRELHTQSENSARFDMIAAIQQAHDARLFAESLDPSHTDPAWQIDVFVGKAVSHAELMRFYESFLAAH